MPVYRQGMTLSGTLFSNGRHVRRHPRVTAAVMAALVAIAATIWTMVGVQSASASSSYGSSALNWAESHAAGHWYAWAGTGPSSYDCSGLVMEAYGHAAGIWLPHSTYAMLGSGHLVRTWSPQRGDLAFYGSGHVEFVTIWYHTTFGAHATGQRIGWIGYGGWWQPTAFYRVVR